MMSNYPANGTEPDILDGQMSSATFPSNISNILAIFRRIAAAVDGRRGYAIAAVCLLIVAVSLRFYNLSESSLRFDEAKAALNSGGALSEAVLYTRNENTSPILYPLALWAVQKAQSTDFSVRLLPAAGSALTVGALLFLMPRVGVPRRAAFLAALLAALSAVAIEHAQDAREYSLAALAAALMIAGLLQYLRNGGKWLLCGTLFVAPLLQYGLILFGVAVIGVAALAPAAASSQAAAVGVGRAGGAAIWGRIGPRLGLLLPIACFVAACALTWDLTARYQWTADARDGGAYLANSYYDGGFNVAAMVEFALNRVWDLLIYHMPPIAAAVALFAVAVAQRFRRFNAVGLLFACALGVALFAALTGAYPLGGIRQCLYLGPLIFLAVGWAFHSLGEDAVAAWRRRRAAAALGAARRRWAAPALTAVVVGAIALAGANDIRQRDVYNSSENYIKQIFAILDERAQEGDAVYVSQWEVPLVAFYKKEKPDNYFYGRVVCWESSGRGCVSDVFNEMFGAFGDAPRIWMIHTASVKTLKEMERRSSEVKVEEVVNRGWTTLHLITEHEEFAANVSQNTFAMYEDAISGDPIATAAYNLHLQDYTLHYSKEPCGPADIELRFFLHLYPEDVNDLPGYHRNVGFHNLDFNFHEHGLLAANKCVIRRDLPEYPIAWIHTGQFIRTAPLLRRGPYIWEVEVQVNR